jgi:hypothetical protein
LVSHFYDVSVIFYAIYKNSKTVFTIGVSFCTEAPGINSSFAMSPLAMEGGGAGPNSGVPVGDLAGKDGERD